jgi:hypothetical protein
MVLDELQGLCGCLKRLLHWKKEGTAMFDRDCANVATMIASIRSSAERMKKLAHFL